MGSVEGGRGSRPGGLLVVLALAGVTAGYSGAADTAGGGGPRTDPDNYGRPSVRHYGRIGRNVNAEALGAGFQSRRATHLRALGYASRVGRMAAVNINASVFQLSDELSEIVGLKSGLVVTPSDVVRLLDRELQRSSDAEWWYSPRAWLHERPDKWVRLRAEDMESLVIRLLYAIGRLPSPDTPIEVVVKFAKEHPDIVDSLPRDADELSFPLPVNAVMRLDWYVHAPPTLDTVRPELIQMLADWQSRSILDLMYRREDSAWDGAVPLGDLFNLPNLGGMTAADRTSPPLIDQRFIDYLHSQPADLTQIHWRQFEFLIGEFFRRMGYEVIVTPPSGDEGVDVRAVRAEGIAGPELVLVQAKRLQDDAQVRIDTVKALWADIDEAHATRGIVATTSALAPGARDYCRARRYRLTAAERPTVEEWLRALATYPR